MCGIGCCEAQPRGGVQRRSSSSVARLGHANACSGREEKHGEAMGARACEETGKDASMESVCGIMKQKQWHKHELELTAWRSWRP